MGHTLLVVQAGDRVTVDGNPHTLTSRRVFRLYASINLALCTHLVHVEVAEPERVVHLRTAPAQAGVRQATTATSNNVHF